MYHNIYDSPLTGPYVSNCGWHSRILALISAEDVCRSLPGHRRIGLARVRLKK